MRNPKIQFVFPIILTVLFNIFFWQEKLGLNLVLFSVLIISALAYLYPSSFRRGNVQITLSGTLLVLAMVLIYNSLISKIAFFVSFMIMVGFVHQRGLRSVLYAGAYSTQTLLWTIPQMLNVLLILPKQLGTLSPRFQKLSRNLRLAGIPLLVFLVFFFIFKTANPVFNDLTDNIGEQIADFLNNFFARFSALRFWFVIWGAWLIISTLFNWNLSDLFQHEITQSNTIQRKRRKALFGFKTLALKSEYVMAIMLVASVNLLLLVVNIIDINWLWLGFDHGKAGKLSEAVHEGTYLLIFSILLSMAILLHFYRNNLNFYARNRSLKYLSYTWLIQNTILVISLFIRTFQYIEVHGLAYKRIGVLIFLVLTIYGLYTLGQKIKFRQSTYSLITHNAWATYGMLIAMSLVDWDVWIVQYNFQYYSNATLFDVDFMLTRADKTLPIVKENLAKLNPKTLQAKLHWEYQMLSNREETRQAFIQNRLRNILRKNKNYSWLSWNYADYQTYLYFEKTLPAKD